MCWALEVTSGYPAKASSSVCVLFSSSLYKNSAFKKTNRKLHCLQQKLICSKTAFWWMHSVSFSPYMDCACNRSPFKNDWSIPLRLQTDFPCPLPIDSESIWAYIFIENKWTRVVKVWCILCISRVKNSELWMTSYPSYCLHCHLIDSTLHNILPIQTP